VALVDSNSPNTNDSFLADPASFSPSDPSANSGTFSSCLSHVPVPASVRDILTFAVDVGIPGKTVLRALAKLCADAAHAREMKRLGPLTLSSTIITIIICLKSYILKFDLGRINIFIFYYRCSFL
jgi:hypothetical protein